MLGTSTELDIGVIHAWSKDCPAKAAEEDGHAAKKYDAKKKTKYSKEILADGNIVNFKPIVLEDLDHWGTKPMNTEMN